MRDSKITQTMRLKSLKLQSTQHIKHIFDIETFYYVQMLRIHIVNEQKKGFTSNRWLLSLRSASRRNLSRRNFHPIHQAPEKAPSDRRKWKGRPGVHFTYKRHQILRIKRRQATTRERRTNGEAGKAEGVGGYGAASLQIGAP